MEEQKTMICPMRGIYSENKETGAITFYKCEREECAWWDNNSDKCAVLSISMGMPPMADVIASGGRYER